MRTAIALKASAVPVSVGVVFLVILSLVLAPVSLAASCVRLPVSGVGAVVSSIMV